MKPGAEAAARGRTAGLRASARAHWAAGRSAEAISVFRKIAQLDPASAEAAYDLGAALFESGALAEAAGHLERALTLRPSLASALVLLATISEYAGREAEAASRYRELGRVSKDPVERRLVLAKALSLEGALEESETELRRTAASAPGHAGVQVLLGQLLLEKGEFSEAEGYLVRALDTFPDVFQSLATSRPITQADRPLLERMVKAATQQGLNPLQRGAIHFGLGKAHNDLREYAEAMSHYDAANALCGGPSRRLDREGLRAYYDGVIGEHSASRLAAQTPSRVGASTADDDLPVLVVGMPRSGTTLVEQILSSHPQVSGADELSFWRDRCQQWVSLPQAPPALAGRRPEPDPIAKLLVRAPATTAVQKAAFEALQRRAPPPKPRLDPALISQAAGDYLALLRQIAPQSLRVIDKAPLNLERLGQIRAALPRIRIIHCRRNPVDTCLSIFFTNYKGRQSWTRGDLVFQYRQYERLMDHWRAVLPSDRFIEVDYESVVSDREAQTRRLVAFCGLDWDDACLAPEANRRVVKSSSLWQARQPTYTRSVERWRHYEPWLGELRELLP